MPDIRAVLTAVALMLAAGVVVAEDNNPDPPDEEEETNCPENYHPIEGLSGFCALDDGTEAEDGECPFGWSNIGAGGTICQCFSTTDPLGNCDDGGTQPGPAGCPSGWDPTTIQWGNGGQTPSGLSGEVWCLPDGGRCEDIGAIETQWGCFYGWYPSDKRVIFRFADVDVLYLDGGDWINLLHYNIDPEKCPPMEAYDYAEEKCEAACDALPGVPCYFEAQYWWAEPVN